MRPEKGRSQRRWLRGPAPGRFKEPVPVARRSRLRWRRRVAILLAHAWLQHTQRALSLDQQHCQSCPQEACEQARCDKHSAVENGAASESACWAQESHVSSEKVKAACCARLTSTPQPVTRLANLAANTCSSIDKRCFQRLERWSSAAQLAKQHKLLRLVADLES